MQRLVEQTPRPPAIKWIYAVIDPKTHAVLYCDTSSGNAAVKLVPGTWFGRGITGAEAIQAALAAAKRGGAK